MSIAIFILTSLLTTSPPEADWRTKLPVGDKNKRLALGRQSFIRQEKLVYSVRYGFFNMGEIRLELNQLVNGLNYIRCEQETKGLFSCIFKIKDWYESLTDSNFVTVRFEKNVEEGSYKEYQLIIIENGYAKYPASPIASQGGPASPTSQGGQDGDSIPVIEGAKDIISILYWLRTQRLKPGDSIKVPLHADKQNHEIKVQVKEENVDGRPCLLAIPDLCGAKAFGSEGGLELYYDEDKIPILLKIKFMWGYLQAKLKHRSIFLPQAD
ncbi:DUF3108 domain-containing protein [candidate division WOR-3 bacterium]|nr:DUF3108 domain-containing protein [candidate division WOR-3 bacterium]